MEMNEMTATAFGPEPECPTGDPQARVFHGPGGKTYSALEVQALMMQPWSNNACLGYIIRALEELDIPEKQIRQVARAVRDQFERITLEEADQHYCHSPY